LGGVKKTVTIKVIVKYYVTEIGQAEIGQWKTQNQIWICITDGITEKSTSAEIGAGIHDLVAKAHSILAVDVKQGWLIHTDFLLCF
jgi:hypothetical protein